MKTIIVSYAFVQNIRKSWIDNIPTLPLWEYILKECGLRFSKWVIIDHQYTEAIFEIHNERKASITLLKFSL